MLPFPTTPLSDPSPLPNLCLSPSGFFPLSPLAVFHSSSPVFMSRTSIVPPPRPPSCRRTLCSSLSLCPSSSRFLPVSSLHPSLRWSGGCHPGELALEVGAGQSVWILAISTWNSGNKYTTVCSYVQQKLWTTLVFFTSQNILGVCVCGWRLKHFFRGLKALKAVRM